MMTNYQELVFSKIDHPIRKEKKIVSSSKQYGEEEEGWVRYSVGVHAASSGRPSWRDVATAWPFLRGRVRARHNTIII